MHACPQTQRSSPPTVAVEASYVTEAHCEEISEIAFECHLDGGGDVCCFPLIERAKEFLGGITEQMAAEAVASAADAAEAVAAMSLPDKEEDGGAAIADDAEDAAAASASSWVFEPASTRFKQPRRRFDVIDDGEAAVEIFHGEILEDRKSRFQAHAARVTSEREVSTQIISCLSPVSTPLLMMLVAVAVDGADICAPVVASVCICYVLKYFRMS